MPRTRKYGLTPLEAKEDKRERREARIRKEISQALGNYIGAKKTTQREIAAQIGVDEHKIGAIRNNRNVRLPGEKWLMLFDLIGFRIA